MRLLLLLLIGLCDAVCARADACHSLSVGQSINIPFGHGTSVCAHITVKFASAQILVSQPMDLALRLDGAAGKETADGFEFGNETITILEPGDYRVEIDPVEKLTASPLNLTMSVREISLQAAKKWREAEVLASTAKKTQQLEDITIAMDAWQGLNDVSSIARTLLKRGDVYLAVNSRVNAREAYERALALCTSQADTRCQAEAANNSGWVSHLLGDFANTSQRLGQAASLWKQLAEPALQGRTLSNLGLMYWQAGDFDLAIEALEHARKLQSGRDEIALARVLNNIGLCYQSLAAHSMALAYFHDALAILEARHRTTMRTRLNQGRSYMLLGGALAKAERAFQGALQEAENLKDAAGRGDALANLGQVSLLLGKPQRARGYLEDALAVQRAIHSRRGEAVALHLLGSEALSRGDLPAARSAFSQAVAIRRESGMRDEVSESLFELAKLEFQAGNTATARDLVGEAITLIEVERTKVPEASLRASYSSRKHSFYDLLIEIAMSDGHDRSGELGLLASEQAHGRSLADVLSGSRLPGEVPSDLLARRDQVRKQLSVLSLRMTEADPPKLTDPERLTLQARRKELRVQVQPLLAEEGRIDEAIRRTVRGSVLGRPLTYVEHLRKALPRDTAVLEYYLGERHSYLWLIDSTGTRAYRLPPKGDWEKLALRTARSFAAISQRRDSEAERKKFEADRAALAKILVGPLTKVRLPHRLVLVLDGILYQFPVEALRRPGFRDELGLNYEILRAPSAAYLLSGATPRPHTAFPKALLAVADPVFSTEDERFTMRPARSAGVLGLPRLPFGDERKNFQALVPGRRLGELWGFAATPGALLNMDLGIYAVIHFSTHTLIDERTPELSRVVLTQVNRTGKRVDGSLYTHEMADLRLRGATVVLSSCESARGKDVAGEGVVGFGSALLSAGASQLVLSLAKVDSAPAEAFFGEVYRHFLGRRPTTMPAALLRARQHLARSTDWRDPFYWASFTVLGALSNEAPGQPTETSRAHL